MTTVLKRVIFLGCVAIGLCLTAIVMIIAGFIPANGWGPPQHEVAFGIVIGGMAGIILTLTVLLWKYNLR